MTSRSIEAGSRIATAAHFSSSFFVSQGYNLDDIQDGIDHMISEGQIDFTTDINDGDQLVCLITEGMPESNCVGASEEQ